MPNNKDRAESPFRRILNVGRTGSGKSTQMWTLPGKKFLYMFDPNTASALEAYDKKGNRLLLDIEYEQYLPDAAELDATLKGFNKGSKDDRLKSGKKEPTVYNTWVEDINDKVESGWFEQEKIDWLCVDSLTFLNRAIMARQMHINDRYGGIEELGDYRVVGSKVSEVFSSIASLPINVYVTGHIQVFENEKTQRMETLINTNGSSRTLLPLLFSEIWLAEAGESDKDGIGTYTVRTRPDKKGLQDIRSSLKGLKEVEDVTIRDFGNAEEYGIGAILKRQGK